MASILVLNAGSSTVKLGLFEASDPDKKICSAKLEQRLSEKVLTITEVGNGSETRTFNEVERNIDILLKWITERNIELIAIGHRVVHGGRDYTSIVKLDQHVVERITSLGVLAPLHQYAALEYINAFMEKRPQIPDFAYFDTAFHRDIPKVARMFGLPKKYADDGIMRYGFHGIAYESVMYELKKHIYRDMSNQKIVAIHLGNGCSTCAIYGGKSIDTSLGFTTIDGLLMGTRCGSLDPGVPCYLMSKYDMSSKDVERVLYKESGLKGLSGITNDVRELQESNDPAAKEALDVFCYMAMRQVFSIIGVLGGVDIVVFSGGIGENSAVIREKICSKMEWLGLKLDGVANKKNATILSEDSSNIVVCRVCIDEEQVIARHIANAMGNN